MGPPGRCSREFGMKWRVMLELVGPDGTVGVHEVGGRAAVAEYAPQMIGLTLEEGKHLLAALQVHLVQAQAEDHSRRRRRCQRCGALRPLKDQRSRRLVSLFHALAIDRGGLKADGFGDPQTSRITDGQKDKSRLARDVQAICENTDQTGRLARHTHVAYAPTGCGFAYPRSTDDEAGS